MHESIRSVGPVTPLGAPLDDHASDARDAKVGVISPVNVSFASTSESACPTTYSDHTVMLLAGVCGISGPTNNKWYCEPNMSIISVNRSIFFSAEFRPTKVSRVVLSEIPRRDLNHGR